MTKDGGLHVARGVTSGVSHAVKPTCRLAICCWRREKRVLQLLAARPSYCNWTHRESAQNQFFGCWDAYLPPPIPLHRAALLEGACSLTSPMRRLSCRHIVAGSSASLRSIRTWTRSRHDEETLSVVMQPAPKNSAEVLSDCRSRGHL